MSATVLPYVTSTTVSNSKGKQPRPQDLVTLPTQQVHSGNNAKHPQEATPQTKAFCF